MVRNYLVNPYLYLYIYIYTYTEAEQQANVQIFLWGGKSSDDVYTVAGLC